MRLFVRIIIVVLILTVGAVFLNTVYTRPRGDIMDGPDMFRDPIGDPIDSDIESVCWYYGGGELGGRHSYTLTNKSDSYVELEVITREEWDAPETTLTCVVDSAYLNDIATIIDTHNLREAENNGGENYVLDGDTWSLTVKYKDGTRFELEEHQDFSDSEYDGINAIRDILEALYESERL